jgi:hypothetical protein
VLRSGGGGGGGGGGGARVGAPGKNNHKIFASTLGKLARASVREGQEICNGWSPIKAGIGEIEILDPLFW